MILVVGKGKNGVEGIPLKLPGFVYAPESVERREVMRNLSQCDEKDVQVFTSN